RSRQPSDRHSFPTRRSSDLNLLGNALKFTPAGGFASVRLEEADDGAILEVRDNGPGIPPDELPHIFDRFYRGTNTGEARASGSGDRKSTRLNSSHVKISYAV